MALPREETVGESIIEITVILVSSAISWTVCALIIKRDEKKLSEEMLARAYPPATLAVSVFLFQSIAVLVHFVRTRRSIKGFFLGLGWAVVSLVPSYLLEKLFELIFPE